jgi:hypothetical protein
MDAALNTAASVPFGFLSLLGIRAFVRRLLVWQCASSNLFQFGIGHAAEAVKQLLNRAPLRRVGSDARQCPVVLDVLPNDKTLD